MDDLKWYKQMTGVALFMQINNQDCLNIYLANSVILTKNETHKWITNMEKKKILSCTRSVEESYFRDQGEVTAVTCQGVRDS